MDEIGTTHATCGSGDYDGPGRYRRCDDPAPYRAEYRDRDYPGHPYGIPVCVRHAHDARTDGDLERIYTAGTHVAADAN